MSGMLVLLVVQCKAYSFCCHLVKKHYILSNIDLVEPWKYNELNFSFNKV